MLFSEINLVAARKKYFRDIFSAFEYQDKIQIEYIYIYTHTHIYIYIYI